MLGFHDGVDNRERNELRVPEKCLAAYGDGFEYGSERRKMALQYAKYFDSLDEVNKKAFELWNLNGQRSDLPDPPSASGCHQHYCWMPVDTTNDNHLCKAHGGKDAPLPKKRK